MSRRPGSRSGRPLEVPGLSTDPDPRFLLANERTFLAWIRTALALEAVGVALVTVSIPVADPFRLASCTIFVGLGVLTAIQAWVGWVQTNRALREQRSLPPPPLAILLPSGVVLATVLLAVGFTR